MSSRTFFGPPTKPSTPSGSRVKTTVTTTVVRKPVSLSNRTLKGLTASSSGSSDGFLAAPKPVKAGRTASSSPPPRKRARTGSDESSSQGKSKNGTPRSDRVVELGVVDAPPSRGVTPVARPKHIPRKCAAEVSDGQAMEFVTAASIVMEGLTEFEPYFGEMKESPPPQSPTMESDTKVPKIVLEYPAKGASEELMQPRPRKGDREGLWDPIIEVRQSIIVMLECYLTPQESMKYFAYVHGSYKVKESLSGWTMIASMERAYSQRDRLGFLRAVERFNTTWRQLRDAGLFEQKVKEMPGVDEKLWQHVCGQAYDRTVGPRSYSLGVYQAWSSNVYGELLPPFVADIIHATELGPGKICVDLGSGVGNCMVQASLAAGCESHGFEMMPAASLCATLQVAEAQTRWRMWGLSGGQVHAIQADFVKQAEMVLPILQKADVIICNNFVFSAELNGDIVQLLLDAKDGAQVVHLKPFSPAVTERSLDSPAAILRQGPKRRWGRKYVSWSDVEGDYYISTVDREAYQRRLQAALERSSSRQGRRSPPTSQS